MPTKLEQITAMYEDKLRELTGSEQEWMRFLTSASRNYKLSFDEQMLIHAQRPDATAVLELEKWNKQFGRWVNRGATGIAVIDRTFPGKTRLKYYFDISDTHGSQYDRPVPIWEMKPEYTSEVIETLEASFGDLNEKDSLVGAIISASGNAVADNLDDYLRDLLDSRQNSQLEGLDENNIKFVFSILLEYSTAYMLLSRCGVDPTNLFKQDDFRWISRFDTPETLGVLGAATSAIAETGLREIASTVLNLQKSEREQNRTFADNQNIGDNIIKNSEGSFDYDNHLQRAKRLSYLKTLHTTIRPNTSFTKIKKYWRTCDYEIFL